MDKRAITEAWAKNVGFLDIEELLNNWPYFTSVERHMHVVTRCLSCGREIVDVYRRQNPDFLAWQKCCHWCAREVIAAEVIPFTLWRRFRSLSFNTAGHCWECGQTVNNTYLFTFRSGLTVNVCRKHRIAYQRHIARMNALADVKHAALENMRKQWFKYPEEEMFTLASNPEEALTRFVRESGNTTVFVELASSQEIEARNLENWIF